MDSLDSALKDLPEDQINIVRDVSKNIKMSSTAFKKKKKNLHFKTRFTGDKLKERDRYWLLN